MGSDLIYECFNFLTLDGSVTPFYVLILLSWFVGSSTVLVPARVAQALNLNLDEMCAQPQNHSRFNGRRLNSENGKFLSHRNYYIS